MLKMKSHFLFHATLDYTSTSSHTSKQHTCPHNFFWILSRRGPLRSPRAASEAPSPPHQLGTQAQPRPPWSESRTQPADLQWDRASLEPGLLPAGHPKGPHDCTEQYWDGQEHPEGVRVHPLHGAHLNITKRPSPPGIAHGRPGLPKRLVTARAPFYATLLGFPVVLCARGGLRCDRVVSPNLHQASHVPWGFPWNKDKIQKKEHVFL